jgi:hypothetical protein
VCIGSPHPNVVSGNHTLHVLQQYIEAAKRLTSPVALVSIGVAATGEPTNRDFSESMMDYYVDGEYNKDCFIIK